MQWLVLGTNIKYTFYRIMTLEGTDVEDDHLNVELSNENIALLASSIGLLGEINTEQVQEWIECDLRYPVTEI